MKIQIREEYYLESEGKCIAGPFRNKKDAENYAIEISNVDIKSILEKIANDIKSWDDEKIRYVIRNLIDIGIIGYHEKSEIYSLDKKFRDSFKFELNKIKDSESPLIVIIKLLQLKLNEKDIPNATTLLYEMFLFPYVESQRKARNRGKRIIVE